jgi:hypothetical protein
VSQAIPETPSPFLFRFNTDVQGTHFNRPVLRSSNQGGCHLAYDAVGQHKYAATEEDDSADDGLHLTLVSFFTSSLLSNN